MEVKDIAEYEEKDSRLARNTIAELHKEIDRLNNIINELEKRLEQGIEDNKKEYSLHSQMAVSVLRDTLELIEELKGSDKE